MKSWRNTIVGIAALGLFTGCAIIEVPVPGDEDVGYGEYDDYYVDAYVSIPVEVRELISSHVDGYSMPPVSRYGYMLYPENVNDPYNLPSYVSSDFNGDNIYDYAYMFSQLSWTDGDWYLKTKMLVVLSTSYGYTIGSEIVLGTVSGHNDTPVEEYWGIRLLPRGTHVVTTYENGYEREESIDLPNDAIYLASVDPDERSVFYAHGTDVHEIVMDMGAVAKKKAGSSDSRENRIVKISTSTLKKTPVLN